MILYLAINLLAASLILATGLWLGWKMRTIQDWLEDLTKYVTTKVPRKPEPPKPEGTGAVILDPTDPVQRARWQQEQIRRGQNSE